MNLIDSFQSSKKNMDYNLCHDKDRFIVRIILARWDAL